MIAVAGALARIARSFDDQAPKALAIMSDDAYTGPGRLEHDQAFRDVAVQAKAASQTLTAEAKMLERGARELERAQKLWDEQKRARISDRGRSWPAGPTRGAGH